MIYSNKVFIIKRILSLGRIVCCCFILSLLVACVPNEGGNLAPVNDVVAQHAERQGTYVVQPGETLYFIAWRLNMDYLRLAELNQLSLPYTIYPGQTLRLRASARTLIRSKPSKSLLVLRSPQKVSRWAWPVAKVKMANVKRSKHGIVIFGQRGQAILAAASGQVVFAGQGIPGYGKLIIVKNNPTFMSVYAHNMQILVKQGSYVKIGQVVARMGSTGTNRVQLYFEIRAHGKVVNPLQYLSQ